MMTTLILAVALQCYSPNLVDRTGLGFSDWRSKSVIARSYVVCKEKYGKCPVMIRRNTETSYSIICGVSRKNSSAFGED